MERAGGRLCDPPEKADSESRVITDRKFSFLQSGSCERHGSGDSSPGPGKTFSGSHERGFCYDGDADHGFRPADSGLRKLSGAEKPGGAVF